MDHRGKVQVVRKLKLPREKLALGVLALGTAVVVVSDLADRANSAVVELGEVLADLVAVPPEGPIGESGRRGVELLVSADRQNARDAGLPGASDERVDRAPLALEMRMGIEELDHGLTTPDSTLSPKIAAVSARR